MQELAAELLALVFGPCARVCARSRAKTESTGYISSDARDLAFLRPVCRRLAALLAPAAFEVR